MWQIKEKNNTKSILYAINDVRGITLIALIITIVVLLILAGITVASLTGGDGTMEKAQQAKDKTALSQKVEEVNNAIVMSTSNKFNEDIDMNKLQANLGKLSGVTLSTTTFPAKVEILGEPYIIYSDGELFKGSNGNTRVPIPDGFVASVASGENDVTNGLVIYEGDEPVTDSNVATARRERNQFVWVPVDGSAIKFEQVHTYDDKQYYYSNSSSDVNGTTQWKWADTIGASNIRSVTKYGGFYVGRYEAGWAQKNNGDNYEQNKHDTTKLPVCRKGYAAWNYIYQTEAKTVCENLYKNSESVKSQLIDSYAWDTTVKWMMSTDSRVRNNPRSSTSYGKYYDSNYTFPSTTTILYANHNNANGGLTVTGTYSKGSGVNIFHYVEIGTGEYETANVNNIYDLAGNMWEWTTEVGDRSETSVTSGTYAVRRGGCFDNSGSSYPVVSRTGYNLASSNAHYSIGFRPVLYLK